MLQVIEDPFELFLLLGEETEAAAQSNECCEYWADDPCLDCWLKTASKTSRESKEGGCIGEGVGKLEWTTKTA